MLVTDLDGTLLGCPAAVRRFHRWREDAGRNVVLVYATGRTRADVMRLVAAGELPQPTYIVGSLGAEIYGAENDAPWSQEIAVDETRWNAPAVRKTVLGFAQARIQEDEFQSPRKASFYLENADPSRLAEISAALSRVEMDCELLYSGNRFLDALPRGVSKGAAAEAIASRLGVEPSTVVACGDSGNDVSLYNRGFRGVIVANAEPSLIAAAGREAYVSPLPHADGVLDGYRYWQEARPTTAPTSKPSQFTRGARRNPGLSANRDTPE